MKDKTSPGEESIRDKFNIQFNIHRHIDRMSSIITNPMLDENRYNWAIDHLLSMLEPYGDDVPEFKEEMQKLKDEYDGKEGRINKAQTTAEQSRLIKERNRKVFLLLNNLMKKLGVGLEMQGSEVIGE